MHLRKTFLLILVFTCSMLQAQDKLIVQGARDNLFVLHEVTEKESLSSIGRIYGIAAKQLALYNDINVNALLALGAELRFPLSAENFSSQANLETNIALYHIATRDENLYQMSQLYNKVPVATLRKWNDLSSDNVRNGQAIIIGFINGTKPQLTPKMVGDPSLQNALAKPIKAEPPPLKNYNVLDARIDGARELKGELKPLTYNELILYTAAQEKIRKENDFNGGMINTQPSPDEVKIGDDEMRYIPQPNDEGYFQMFFWKFNTSSEKQSKTGEAAIFNSKSGISDRKFYVLANNILPGTIVRISASNKKAICARVLGPIPESTNAEGLLLYISNAAAAALGLKETGFLVNLVCYPK
jgi:LysM repeat protein